MNETFRKLLHDFKVGSFKLTHNHETLEGLTQETLHYTEETLRNQYSFHFHRLADAGRAEIINMINNYTVEALLPPVVEKLLRRIVVLEKRQEMLVDLLVRVLETLSGPQNGEEAGGRDEEGTVPRE